MSLKVCPKGWGVDTAINASLATIASVLSRKTKNKCFLTSRVIWSTQEESTHRFIPSTPMYQSGDGIIRHISDTCKIRCRITNVYGVFGWVQYTLSDHNYICQPVVVICSTYHVWYVLQMRGSLSVDRLPLLNSLSILLFITQTISFFIYEPIAVHCWT